ncbi:MAG: hypothetical protein QOH25_1783 [Acidobacteriota bacterium]|jgi:putative NIF3 family GTP cyclohydrolase 1 type 2|nr:hypothetical protein [Acidobacteriota bacterium]
MSKEVVKVEREHYEADRPIKSSREDRFGRSEFAKRIASVITGRREASSIVVGVYGPWGEGKTSVLNMVIEELEGHLNSVAVRFNPWRFSDESQLLHNFFSVLAEKLDARLKTRGENISEMFRRYSGLLAAIPYAGSSAKEIANVIGSLHPAADLEELKDRLEVELGNAETRIVVVMDDIDRLDKEEIQAVFKLVKLSADFPNMAYILAFDEQMVSAALAEEYGSFEAGRSFLEKIVQVPLRLPHADSEALRRITFEGVGAALKLAGIELSEQQVRKFARLFERAFERGINTPRLVKRYVNGLTFALPLLKDEVNPVDLLVIEAVRAFYPSLYASIRDNPSAYVGGGFRMRHKAGKAEEEGAAVIADALKDMTPYERHAAEQLIREIFPSAAGSFGDPSHGSDSHSRWTSQKRIASEEYFHRYFAYGVPPKDVSDRMVQEVLSSGEAGDVNYVKTQLKAIAASAKPGTLLAKLFRQADSVPTEYAARLALAVAEYGELFPQDESTFVTIGLSAFSQAGFLISALLKRIEDETERDKVALHIADVVTPLPFALEYAQAVTKVTEEGEVDVVISEEAEVEVHRKIGSRIAEAAADGGFFRKYPKDLLSLYTAWRCVDEEAVRRSLSGHLRTTPHDVLLLLENAMPISTSGRDTVKMELRGYNYNRIAELIDPELVIEALAQVYGDIDAFVKHTGGSLYDLPPEERAAKSFIRLHRKRQQQSTAGRSGTVEDVAEDSVQSID